MRYSPSENLDKDIVKALRNVEMEMATALGTNHEFVTWAEIYSVLSLLAYLRLLNARDFLSIFAFKDKLKMIKTSQMESFAM